MDGVTAANGSSAEGGCPSSCVGIDQVIRTCNCPTFAGLPPEATTGVILDGIIPTLNMAQPNWATQLFTMQGVRNTIILSALFETQISLSEVDMYIFYCPSWGIAVEEIVVHFASTYPPFVRLIDSLGNVSLSPEMENCGSLIRISIPLSFAPPTNIYAIEFTNPSLRLIGWMHLAEVRYSDRLIHLPIIGKV